MNFLSDMAETRSMIAIFLILTFCAITIMGKPVPTELKDVLMMVIGFLYGSKFSSENQQGGTNANIITGNNPTVNADVVASPGSPAKP